MRALKTWRPRCCPSCGDALEDYATRVEPDTYVPCYRCARLFAATDDGLEPVLLSLEAPELRLVFEDLVAAWWAGPAKRVVQPENRAA